MSERSYLSCAETAKLIRGALKKAFPGVKFSVRSHTYAGGASIDVDWTDGPSRKAVEKVAKVYAGGGFDGMIDMAYSVDSWLMPDGSATWGSSQGTEGSRGVTPGYNFEKPHPEARKVHFGANFVSCNKHHSLEKYTDAAKRVCDDYGYDLPEIKVCIADPYVPGYHPVLNAGNIELGTLIHRELEKENA